jgi:hypothetical protein
LGSRGRWISEFEASLVYKVSSRTAQRNPVLKNNNNNKKKKKPNQKKKKRGNQGAGEMAQWLRAVCSPRGLSSIPKAHKAAHNSL